MQYLRTFCKTTLLPHWLPRLAWVFLLSICGTWASAQCPDNIDFEKGSLDGWTCYTGFVSAATGQNSISLSVSGPQSGRHELNGRGSGVDPYGGFPVNCPNGSNYSIKLGNDQGGGQAEGISYEFTIPANKNTYSLMYYYAVVFQDPNHLEFQQPRMEIEITNVTDNEVISCSSFTWIPFGTVLPGFFESQTPGSSTPVWCKDWTPVSINLNNMAGKVIRLFFKTSDCTFQRHFGYAYIDVNTECSGDFVGATFCPDDSLVNVLAPFGFQSYAWYDSSLTTLLGSQQVLTLRPPPTTGTTVAVSMQPYAGFGCPQTLYAHLIDSLKVKADAGRDMLSCNHDGVVIGTPPKLGLVYTWSPPTGLSDHQIANPVASPDQTTTYVLTTRHDGGGCVTTDTVVVRAGVINNALQLLGKASYCVDMGDSSVLQVMPADSIQWYKDGAAIPGATGTKFSVTQSGVYQAMLYDKGTGCSTPTEQQTIFIDRPRPGVAYPVEYAVKNLTFPLAARNFGETYLWKPAINLDNAVIVNPQFKGETEQLYTIEITTKTGCTTVDTQMVKVVKEIQIFVPSAFTPNHDGKNDLLRPIMQGMKDLRYFRIYNRWGELLFETQTKFDGWDGKVKGIPQGSGVVVWIAEGVGLDGLVYRRKGTTVLVR